MVRSQCPAVVAPVCKPQTFLFVFLFRLLIQCGRCSLCFSHFHLSFALVFYWDLISGSTWRSSTPPSGTWGNIFQIELHGNNKKKCLLRLLLKRFPHALDPKQLLSDFVCVLLPFWRESGSYSHKHGKWTFFFCSFGSKLLLSGMLNWKLQSEVLGWPSAGSPTQPEFNSPLRWNLPRAFCSPNDLNHVMIMFLTFRKLTKTQACPTQTGSRIWVSFDVWTQFLQISG